MNIRTSIWPNIALAVLAPAVFFAILESILFVFGVKPLSLTEDPFVGFSSLQPLFLEERAASGEPVFKTNPAKLAHFNSQSFPVKKSEGTYRIFTVGGSTTYGHPWRDPVSYPGWLRELLPAADPGRKWEVVNAGGISYASYREAKLVEEITRYRPDLVIVYSGHNEFLEERTYRKTAEIPGFIREAGALLDRTRTYSLMRAAVRDFRENRQANPAAPADKPRLAGEVDDVLARTIGPTSYVRDDGLHRAVLDHYRASLRRIARLAESAGARTLFLTTPGNERDCSPFKSQATDGLSAGDIARRDAWIRAADSLEALAPARPAYAVLDSAARLDPRNAGLLYRAGKSALAEGRHGEAKRLLRAALDEDVCPLRALTAMRDAVLEVARETGSEVLDVGAALEAKTRAQLGHDILGEPHFVDHVHLSIDEYRGIALGVMDRLAGLGVLKFRAGWGERVVADVTDKVMGRMGSRELGEGLHNIAKVLNWAGKHEDAVRIAAHALSVDSTGLEAIWSSLFIATALERQSRSAEAVLHYRRALRLDSANEMARKLLLDALARAGARLLQEGKPAEALQHLEAAGADAPDRPDLLVLLGDARHRASRPADAALAYRRALQLNPGEARALLGLARLAEARGARGEAITLYARALALAPDLQEAHAALSRAVRILPASP